MDFSFIKLSDACLICQLRRSQKGNECFTVYPKYLKSFSVKARFRALKIHICHLSNMGWPGRSPKEVLSTTWSYAFFLDHNFFLKMNLSLLCDHLTTLSTSERAYCQWKFVGKGLLGGASFNNIQCESQSETPERKVTTETTGDIKGCTKIALKEKVETLWHCMPKGANGWKTHKKELKRILENLLIIYYLLCATGRKKKKTYY